MVSHPETDSDSPIGSDPDRGRDIFDISFIYTFISSYTILYFYLHSYTFHIRYFCML